MKHGSLFSGIGGFDLAAEWMGWENVFHCEWNPFGQKVLHHYWPKAIQYHDITQTDFTIHRGTIDILTGGFPCQPYSMAGKRLGKEDERHLWPEMLRAIREIAPRYVVGENVLGLTNWNGGMVFDEVHSDLESAGYEVQAVVLPAAAVNAPHGRDRVWFVAYAGHNTTRKAGGCYCNEKSESSALYEKGQSGDRPAIFDCRLCDLQRLTADTDSDGQHRRNCEHEKHASSEFTPKNTMRSGCTHGEPEQERTGIRQQRNTCTGSSDGFYLSKGFTADTDSGRLERTTSLGWNGEYVMRQGEFGFATDTEPKGRKRPDRVTGSVRFKPGTWDNWPTTEPVIRGGDDGLPTQLDGITFSKWRNESIKAYGNAVVPQVVYQIFKAIAAIDRQEVNP
jgi:DNA (cytosine-5)-methyltransferase 1